MSVIIHDPFVSNLGIAKCLNQYNYPWIIHCTLTFFLCACISPFYTKFPFSSINCNIVVKDILQTRPRLVHEREFMDTIMRYRQRTKLPHSVTLEYRENMCVLPADIPHTEINHQLSMNPCNSAITLKVPNLSSSAESKWCTNSMPCRSPQMLEHSRIITTFREFYSGVHVFHLGSHCSSWQAPRVS